MSKKAESTKSMQDVNVQEKTVQEQANEVASALVADDKFFVGRVFDIHSVRRKKMGEEINGKMVPRKPDKPQFDLEAKTLDNEVVLLGFVGDDTVIRFTIDGDIFTKDVTKVAHILMNGRYTIEDGLILEIGDTFQSAEGGTVTITDDTFRRYPGRTKYILGGYALNYLGEQ